jgi:uncharacterized glyoxalase superfamily protein PhnB
MKIWRGFGSEHSANLVMIGHFESASEASKAKDIIDRLTEQVLSDVEAKLMAVDRQTDKFTDRMLELLQKLGVYILAPAELEQFDYEAKVQLDGNKVVVTTDEVDVSAFFKVLFDQGAKVEIYSAHQHEGTGYGR